VQSVRYLLPSKSNKHLMTGPCAANTKIELRKTDMLDADYDLNLPWFQGGCSDHVRVESSSFCFPRE